MATTTKPRMLNVTCPHCMSQEDTVRLDLNDLSDINCSGCDATFSAREAAAMFAEQAEKWAKVAAWVDAAPTA